MQIANANELNSEPKSKPKSIPPTFEIQRMRVYNQPFERIILFYGNGILNLLVKEFDLISIFSEEKTTETPLQINVKEANITQHTANGAILLTHHLIPCVLEFDFDFSENTTDNNTLVTFKIKSTSERFDEKINSSKDTIEAKLSKFVEYVISSFCIYMKNSSKFLIQSESEIVEGNREKLFGFFQSLEFFKSQEAECATLELFGDQSDPLKPGNSVKMTQKNAEGVDRTVVFKTLSRKTEPGRKKWTVRFETFGKNVKGQFTDIEFIKITDEETLINFTHIFKEAVSIEQMKEIKKGKKYLFKRLKKYVGIEDEDESSSSCCEEKEEREEEDKRSLSSNELRQGLEKSSSYFSVSLE